VQSLAAWVRENLLRLAGNDRLPQVEVLGLSATCLYSMAVSMVRRESLRRSTWVMKHWQSLQ